METAIGDKFNKKIETLHKRNEERLLDIEKEKDDKKHVNAENEKIDNFRKVFSRERAEIESIIDKAIYTPKTELPLHFDTISKNISALQRYVANSNIFLRGYDIKVFQKNLQDLTIKAKDLEEKLLPKKKFGFKKKPKYEKNIREIQTLTEVDLAKVAEIDINGNSCQFKNRTNENLDLDSTEMFRKDVNLSNLKKCYVTLYGSPSTLHISSLEDCYIFCGPVSTSIFVENCKDCTFVIACQQLRLHNSANVSIYLHVTSRAIMEDCKMILLAPYNLKYDNMEKDFQKSGLDISINNWKCVDDFNWLNIEKPSPNWSILPIENREEKWNEIFNGM